MKTLGAHARVDNDRYVVGFALIDGDRLESQWSLAAPQDEPEAAQLSELAARTADIVASTAPDRFALNVADLDRNRAKAAVARRAEGAILGAVGRTRSIEVSAMSGRGLCKPAGLSGKAKNVEAVDALCSQLQDAPKEELIRNAAAVALVINR